MENLIYNFADLQLFFNDLEVRYLFIYFFYFLKLNGIITINPLFSLNIILKSPLLRERERENAFR